MNKIDQTQDLADRFAWHSPVSRAVQSILDEVRGSAYNLADFIDATIVDCREKSIALTKLEEAVFWANAAASRHQ